MPELPDLEVFAENLSKFTAGKKIKAVEVFKEKPVLPLKPAEFVSMLEGRVVKAVKRTGKQLLFTFTDGTTLLLHLMLHGEIYFIEEKEALPDYAVVSLLLSDKHVLVFKDHTQWLKLRLNTKAEEAIDPLTKDFNSGFFTKMLKKKPQACIKELLLDQDVITGIGSAYADEICYNSKIKPQRVVGKLSRKEMDTLFENVGYTLKDAIRKIKRGMNRKMTGEFTDHFAVHGKKKGTCPKGHKIETIKVAGRGSEYCPNCQK